MSYQNSGGEFIAQLPIIKYQQGWRRWEGELNNSPEFPSDDPEETSIDKTEDPTEYSADESNRAFDIL